MAITMSPALPEVQYVDKVRGSQILDEQARRQLRMSGDDFIKRYRSGDLEGLDETDVFDVALLLPFAGESLNGRGKP